MSRVKSSLPRRNMRVEIFYAVLASFVIVLFGVMRVASFLIVFLFFMSFSRPIWKTRDWARRIAREVMSFWAMSFLALPFGLWGVRSLAVGIMGLMIAELIHEIDDGANMSDFGRLVTGVSALVSLLSLTFFPLVIMVVELVEMLVSLSA